MCSIGYLIYFHPLLQGAGLWVGDAIYPEFCFHQGAGVFVHATDIKPYNPEIQAWSSTIDHICNKKEGNYE